MDIDDQNARETTGGRVEIAAIRGEGGTRQTVRRVFVVPLQATVEPYREYLHRISAHCGPHRVYALLLGRSYPPRHPPGLLPSSREWIEARLAPSARDCQMVIDKTTVGDSELDSDDEDALDDAKRTLQIIGR
jgi:hypothetical protein